MVGNRLVPQRGHHASLFSKRLLSAVVQLPLTNHINISGNAEKISDTICGTKLG